MKRYDVFEGRYNDSEGCRVGYGLKASREDGTDMLIEDITPDRERAEELAELFNTEELDPVHFEQAVEDYLLELS